MTWNKWKSYIFRQTNNIDLNYGPCVPTTSLVKRHAIQQLLQNISQNKLVLFQYKKLPHKKKFNQLFSI